MSDEHEIRVEIITVHPGFGFSVWVGGDFALADPDKDRDGLDEPYGTLAWFCGLRGRQLAKERGGKKRKERA